MQVRNCMIFACEIEYLEQDTLKFFILFLIQLICVCLLLTYYCDIFYGLCYFHILHSPVILYTSVTPHDNSLSISPYFLYKLSFLHFFHLFPLFLFLCMCVTKSFVEVDIELNQSDTESNLSVLCK